MSIPFGTIERLSASVQPLVFETGSPDFPYSTAGTTFLVGFNGRAFVLTTRHGLRPDDLGPVCIFPTDESREVLPLKDVYFVAKEDVGDDFGDVAVMSLEASAPLTRETASARIIALSPAAVDWREHSHDAEFLVLGFPADYSFVDYDMAELHNERIAIIGRYVGLSTGDFVHELEFEKSNVALTTYGGFSGSPVFAVFEWESETVVILCGMVIRGTSSSGRMHFVDRAVLINFIEASVSRATKHLGELVEVLND